MGGLAIGTNAHVHDINVQGLPGQGFDLVNLSQDLSRLREAMKNEAPSTSADQDLAIGYIAAAQKAASNNDESGMIQHLKSAGKWALDVATKIGTSLATSALKHAAGLPID